MKPSTLKIHEDQAGQRIDNFLFRTYKGLPKSHIYRILRTGEVRVNKRRIDFNYRLLTDDVLRLPPLENARAQTLPATALDARAFCCESAADPSEKPGQEDLRRARSHGKNQALANLVDLPVLYEDHCLLVLDKPAGIAVHGGSGISFGVIEQLRRSRSRAGFLELVHRLDRQTSGILLIAKKRAALVNLHAQMRSNQVDKRYLVCVRAHWRCHTREVKVRLIKTLTPEGQRRVHVHAEGQPAHTVFKLLGRFADYSLLEAQPKTGRTHQIRVHLAHLEAPIVGDDKYGDFSLNRELARHRAWPGLKRMFLHAFKLSFTHPTTGLALTLEAPLPADCQHFLNQLKQL